MFSYSSTVSQKMAAIKERTLGRRMLFYNLSCSVWKACSSEMCFCSPPCSPPPPWGAFNWGAGEWGPAPL